MSVGVFERAGRLGGGAATVNGPAAGYRMNTCAHWTRFYNHPSYRDFNLYDEGLRYVYPEENEGMVFDDGSSFIGYSASRVVDPVTGRQERSPENVTRTYDQIKRFSQRDADAYLRLLDQYDRYWKPAFGKHRFTTPPPYGTPDAMEALCSIPDSGMEPVHAHMSLQALAYDFFESDELRTLFMRAATTSTGCFGDDTPGLQGLAHNLPLVLSFEPAAIAIGGTQAISDALISAGKKLGVEYHTKAEVDRRHRDGTRERSGIRLADGSTISADVVVSSLGVPQTVLRLLQRRGDLPADHGSGSATSTTTAANCGGPTSPSTNRPRTRLRPTIPALVRSPVCTGGRRIPTTTPRDTRPRSTWMVCRAERSRSHRATRCGIRARAPEGKHIIGVEEFGAPVRLFDKGQWQDIEKKFNEQLIEHWSHYAPNMTPRQRDRHAHRTALPTSSTDIPT